MAYLQQHSTIQSHIKNTNTLISQNLHLQINKSWEIKIKKISHTHPSNMFSSINQLLKPKTKNNIDHLIIDRNNPFDMHTFRESLLTPPPSPPTNNNINSYQHPPIRITITRSTSLTPDPLKITDHDSIVNILGTFWELESRSLPPSPNDLKYINSLNILLQNNLNPNSSNPSHAFTFSNLHPATDLEQNHITDGLYCSLSLLKSILSNLNNKKSSSTDKIPTIALKNLPEPLILEFLILLNNIINNNYIPTAWKISKVIPILKKGKPPTSHLNYRPISLVSNVSKILEHILHNKIQEKISKNNLLPDNQFGFRKGHSTTHAITKLISDTTLHLNSPGSTPTAAVLIDISRAFDSVWLPGLIHKLIELDFHPRLLRVLWSILTARTFSISLGQSNVPSRPFHIHNGLQQGTILAPTLFNIYISSLLKRKSLNSNKSQILAFADDLILYTHTNDIPSMNSQLQKALNSINLYCSKWKLNINTSKCEAIIFRKPLNNYKHSFKSNWKNLSISLDNIPIKQNTSVKYLGLTLDHLLYYTHHINSQLEKAKAAFRSLRNLFHNKYLSSHVKLISYQVFIRPLLSISCPIWYNIPASTMEKLRIFERKCLRTCLSLYYQPNSPSTKYINNQIIYNTAKIDRIDFHILKIIRNHILRSTYNTENSLIYGPHLQFNNQTIISNGIPPPEAFIQMDQLGYIQSTNTQAPLIYHTRRRPNERSIDPTKIHNPAFLTQSMAFSDSCLSRSINNRKRYWWLNSP